MVGLEKRGATRYRGALPVGISGGRGITRDFSTTGIFFETDKSFTPGQTIEFAIMMEHLDTDGPVCLKCVGQIVRVETNGPKLGVAAVISSYSIEKA